MDTRIGPQSTTTTNEIPQFASKEETKEALQIKTKSTQKIENKAAAAAKSVEIRPESKTETDTKRESKTELPGPASELTDMLYQKDMEDLDNTEDHEVHAKQQMVSMFQGKAHKPGTKKKQRRQSMGEKIKANMAVR